MAQFIQVTRDQDISSNFKTPVSEADPKGLSRIFIKHITSSVYSHKDQSPDIYKFDKPDINNTRLSTRFTDFLQQLVEGRCTDLICRHE